MSQPPTHRIRNIQKGYMVKAFTLNDYPTIGIEEEYQLFDPDSGKLVPVMEPIYANLPGTIKQRSCPELHYCTIECHSTVRDTAKDIIEDLFENRKAVAEAAESIGVSMAAAGCNPISNWRDQPVIENEHYQWLLNHHGTVANRMLGLGVHIHIGVRTLEAALYVMHELKRWMHTLSALAANSPFYEQEDTQLASARMYLFNSLPRTSTVPELHNREDLETLYETLHESGAVQAPGDLWWPIRPQLPFGTVESRFLDIQTSLTRTWAFTTLLQAMVSHYQHQYEQNLKRTPINDLYVSHNRWKAMKNGPQAKLIDPASKQVTTVAKHLDQLQNELTESTSLPCPKAHIEHAVTILTEPSGTERQRQWLLQYRHDFPSLTRKLATETLRFDAHQIPNW